MMRMLAATINFQPFDDLAAKFIVREHAPDGGTNHTIGVYNNLLAQTHRLQPTGITRMLVIYLGIEGFFAQILFSSIYLNHIITSGNARGKSGFVFPKKVSRNLRGKTAQVLAGSIHQNPVCFRFSLNDVRLFHSSHLH